MDKKDDDTDYILNMYFYPTLATIIYGVCCTFSPHMNVIYLLSFKEPCTLDRELMSTHNVNLLNIYFIQYKLIIH